MLLVLIGSGGIAHAAPPVFDAASQVISVSPVVVSMSARPGERTSYVTHVANQTSRPWLIQIAAAPLFEPGAAELGTSSHGGDVIRSRTAVGWATPMPSRVTLAAGEEIDVNVSIDVPRDAERGGHYLSLQVIPQPPSREAVAITARISQLVLITVPGARHHRVQVTATASPRVLLRGTTASWKVALHNGGNDHAFIKPVLRVDPLLGSSQTVVGRATLVLPGVTRIVTMHASVRNAPDVIRATVSGRPAGPEERSLPQQQVPSVVMLPWWVIVLLGVVTGILVWRRRVRRRD